MEKRAFERIPLNIGSRFHCEKMEYLGTIVNISKNGMFIKTEKIHFPFASHLDVIIHLKESVLTVPVRVIRMTKSGDVYDGLGVELLNPTEAYLSFVDSLASC